MQQISKLSIKSGYKHLCSMLGIYRQITCRASERMLNLDVAYTAHSRIELAVIVVKMIRISGIVI